jgi:hypothetical protein
MDIPSQRPTLASAVINALQSKGSPSAAPGRVAELRPVNTGTDSGKQNLNELLRDGPQSGAPARRGQYVNIVV